MPNKTNKFNVTINGFNDLGEGKIKFNQGLTITDNNPQWNETRYEIKSMDISQYGGKLTANHSSEIEKVIGKVDGVKKVANRRVIVDGIDFAIKENALAAYAYDMMKAGYLTDFSIETVGPWANEEGIYKDSCLVGLSLVVVGNNKSAKTNQIALNSIEESKNNGLDTSIIEKILNQDKVNKKNKEKKLMIKTIKNNRKFDTVVKYENAAGDKVEKTLKPEETIDVKEDQVEGVEAQIKDAKEPKEEVNMADVVKNAIKPLMEKVNKMEKEIFNASAKEPEFKKNTSTPKLDDMDHEQVLKQQINGFLDWKIRGSEQGHSKLVTGNKLNLEKLKTEGLIKNSMTISDFGNFIISPELLTEIQGYRSNFAGVLSILNYKETLSNQMAWLKRSGDIDMTSVEMCDDDADGNLKPISEYEASQRVSNLEELAAVTPICNAATRFLAADMLTDVTAGYRLDYDRKKAQLFIARLQQAVNYTGYKNPYLGTSASTRLTSFVDTLARVSETIDGGYWILNEKSRLEIVRRAIEAGISGPLSLTLMSGNMEPLLGKRYVVVPNELLPTLNTAETKSFTVDGAAVTIDQSVFYTDPQWFKGRVSGGLQFDLSTEAAYEVSGTVKSAYQRNELVMRGSFFRGGAVTDRSRVSSLYAAGVS